MFVVGSLGDDGTLGRTFKVDGEIDMWRCVMDLMRDNGENESDITNAYDCFVRSCGSVYRADIRTYFVGYLESP